MRLPARAPDEVMGPPETTVIRFVPAGAAARAPATSSPADTLRRAGVHAAIWSLEVLREDGTVDPALLDAAWREAMLASRGSPTLLLEGVDHGIATALSHRRLTRHLRGRHTVLVPAPSRNERPTLPHLATVPAAADLCTVEAPNAAGWLLLRLGRAEAFLAGPAPSTSVAECPSVLPQSLRAAAALLGASSHLDRWVVHGRIGMIRGWLASGIWTPDDPRALVALLGPLVPAPCPDDPPQRTRPLSSQEQTDLLRLLVEVTPHETLPQAGPWVEALLEGGDMPHWHAMVASLARHLPDATSFEDLRQRVCHAVAAHMAAEHAATASSAAEPTGGDKGGDTPDEGTPVTGARARALRQEQILRLAMHRTTTTAGRLLRQLVVLLAIPPAQRPTLSADWTHLLASLAAFLERTRATHQAHLRRLFDATGALRPDALAPERGGVSGLWADLLFQPATLGDPQWMATALPDLTAPLEAILRDQPASPARHSTLALLTAAAVAQQGGLGVLGALPRHREHFHEPHFTAVNRFTWFVTAEQATAALPRTDAAYAQWAEVIGEGLFLEGIASLIQAACAAGPLPTTALEAAFRYHARGGRQRLLLPLARSLAITPGATAGLRALQDEMARRQIRIPPAEQEAVTVLLRARDALQATPDQAPQRAHRDPGEATHRLPP